MVAVAEAPLSASVVLKRKQDRIPLLTRVKVRNLYLNQELPYREIAIHAGITEGQVDTVIKGDGLAQLRKRRKLELIAKADARTDAKTSQVAEAIADEGDEIALGSLGKAKECIANGGKDAAKDFQSWTAGLRNVVTVSRLCRGQDQQQQATGASVNVFVLRCGDMDSKRKERAVTAESIPIPALQ